MYDAITPAQWVIGLTISLTAFGGLASLLWHFSPREQAAQHMSSAAPAPAREVVPEVVQVPVPPTSTDSAPAQLVQPASEAAAPDTNALGAGTEGWQAPRVSRHLTDVEMIAMLATQRTPAGKPRYSANQIHALVGGPRAKVLEQVREIREGPPEFKPLTPEQLAARQALGLDKAS